MLIFTALNHKYKNLNKFRYNKKEHYEHFLEKYKIEIKKIFKECDNRKFLENKIFLKGYYKYSHSFKGIEEILKKEFDKKYK